LIKFIVQNDHIQNKSNQQLFPTRKKTPQIHQGAGAFACSPRFFFATSSPRLTCYAVKGSVATLPAYAPLTAQVGEALGRYEDGSGGQAKREK